MPESKEKRRREGGRRKGHGEVSENKIYQIMLMNPAYMYNYNVLIEIIIIIKGLVQSAEKKEGREKEGTG